MTPSIKKWNEDIQEIQNLKSRFPEDLLLNELIYTRLVSALEVFLTESVNDIFIRKPSIFIELNKSITIHFGEILSLDSLSKLYSKILNSETHNLTRVGFEEILRFYLKLKIDLNGCGPGKEKMLMYHEIRHLIIHRLGKIDSRFKKNYNYHKERIIINDSFLTQAFDSFNKFVVDATNKIAVVMMHP